MVVTRQLRLSATTIALAAALLLLGTSTTRSAAAADAPARPELLSYEKGVIPLLQKYCYQCHGDGKHKADLALDSFKTIDDVKQARAKWELVLDNVRKADMPPEDAAAKPTQAERDQICQWIETELFQVDHAKPDPGRVTIRRMNRAEYNNAIRDLVGVDFQPASDFPPDDSGYGFDNIADVLSIPPILMEKYLAAAERVMDEAIPTEPVKSAVRHVPASLGQVGFNAIGDRGDGWIQLISLEDDDVAVELPTSPGDYIVRVMAFCKPTGGNFVGGGNNSRVATSGPVEPSRISIMVNGTFIQDFAMSTDEAKPGIYEARVGVSGGKNRFRAVMRRIRGGENELLMTNGRIGKQQPGIGLVKYIEVEGPLPAATRRYPTAQLKVTGKGRDLSDGGRMFQTNGEATVPITVTSAGEFTLRAQAYADQAGADLTRMEFRIDGQPLKTFDVIAPAALQPLPRQRVFSLSLLVPVPYVYETTARLSPGTHQFSVAFVNDMEDPENENPNLRDRNLYVDYLEVVDPSKPALQPGMPAPMKALLAAAEQNPDKPAAARQMLASFARRAWRRPISSEEVERLMKLYALAADSGEGFDASVKLAMQAVLVSPNFLFHGDLEPSSANASGESHPVSEIALASRLSYFLWSSIPDDELLSLTERGKLRQNLDAQVRRMLASPKAAALVQNFASQWLQTRSLLTFAPDKDLFPAYDPMLAGMMQKETETFFDYVMRQDRGVMDFITGDYTFVNERLAKFYGIEGVKGEAFQKVSLVGTPRRGVLTQGSVLTLTSNPTRTSPVKRGKWVLENLLGTPPPPPPPDVPPLEKEGHKVTGTLRQQMEQHRADPNCASCHARMDPIGFGLENFDAIGAWRDKEGSADIDATGVLVSGERFKGAAELADILAGPKQDEFLHCLAEKMLTYALGRGTEYYDRPAVDKIVVGLHQNDLRFSALVMEVVHSLPFQMARGEEEK
jgi:hypothetical protein